MPFIRIAALATIGSCISTSELSGQTNTLSSSDLRLDNTHPQDFELVISPNDHDNYHYYAVQLGTSEDTQSRSALFDKAVEIARSLDFHFVERVGELQDCFLFAKSKSIDAASETPAHHIKRLDSPHLVWVEQQIPTKRLFKREGVPQGYKPHTLDDFTTKLEIKDPGFSKQWHLAGNDINIYDVWEQGISGKNVTVAFLDDGLDYDHPDLKDNFYLAGSWDYNENKNLPTPALFDDKHGTRCAGEVAAAQNAMCGVGIAWNARVSGIRILSGRLTEASEAASINFDYQNNHIYSCSWGPSDDGMSMDRPTKLVSDAFYNGIVNGRGGLGSLFVFATGNGALAQDNCNFDGYTNSIYTITVGALDRTNEHPPYAESCAAQLIVTYSSGKGSSIYTSDWPSTCTEQHGGTSAAAPLASGIYALVMGIRPDLSWRDFQYLSVYTAIPVSKDDSSWQKVAKDRMYSHKFGYGKLDASRIVEAAKTHIAVNPHVSHITPFISVELEIPQNDLGISIGYSFTQQHQTEAKMTRLEHVTVSVNIQHGKRGDVEVQLISPNGFVSILGTQRPNDYVQTGYSAWTFMTVKHWEENPIGEWKVIVIDRVNPQFFGTFHSFSITFWGEGPIVKRAIDPIHTLPDVVEPAKNGTSLDSSLNAHRSTFAGGLLLFIIVSALIYFAIKFFRRRRRGVANEEYAFQTLSSKRDVEYGAEDDLSDEEDLEFNRVPPSVLQNQGKKNYFRLE